MSSTKFFGPIGKTRLLPLPLIGWNIFYFSDTAERNSTKLERKQDLNVHYLSSTYFVFFGPIGKTRLPPWPLIGRDISTSPLKPLNRIQRNLTGSKVSMSSSRFVFFGPISEKQDGHPVLWLVETFSTSPKPRNGIQRNLTGSKLSRSLYQVCVFRADRKNKIAALPFDWLRHFRLLLWNRWTEFKETWQQARSQWPLLSLYFSGLSEKQDCCPCLWLDETFSTSPPTPQNGIQRNLTGSKISTSTTFLCFSGRSEEQDGRPGLWLAATFSTSPLKLLNRIQRNLTGSKVSMSSTEVCVFRADRKNKMAALPSDWLRHFLLLLWNRWTEFNETWQQARSERALPILCFSGRSEKQDGRPALWLVETFSTSPPKPLNGIQRNLTRSMISTSST